MRVIVCREQNGRVVNPQSDMWVGFATFTRERDGYGVDVHAKGHGLYMPVPEDGVRAIERGGQYTFEAVRYAGNFRVVKTGETVTIKGLAA
jgi:hypothetical protein